MSTIVQDRHALYTQILRLWCSFQDMHKKYGDYGVTDEDVKLWRAIAAHPACQQRLDDREA